MGKKKDLPILKICILGDKNVGKYSLGQQYAKGWIEPKDTNGAASAYCPTKTFEFEKKKFDVKVQICEVTENEEQLDNCDGLALVFSVTDKSSFTYVNTLFKQLREKFGKSSQNGAGETNGEVIGEQAESGLSIPVILIGNKVDDAKLERQVESDDAKSLCKELSCLNFFETAALCNADVPKAFNCLLSEVARRRMESEPEVTPSKSCCVIM